MATWEKLTVLIQQSKEEKAKYGNELYQQVENKLKKKQTEKEATKNYG